MDDFSRPPLPPGAMPAGISAALHWNHPSIQFLPLKLVPIKIPSNRMILPPKSFFHGNFLPLRPSWLLGDPENTSLRDSKPNRRFPWSVEMSFQQDYSSSKIINELL